MHFNIILPLVLPLSYPLVLAVLLGFILPMFLVLGLFLYVVDCFRSENNKHFLFAYKFFPLTIVAPGNIVAHKNILESLTYFSYKRYFQASLFTLCAGFIFFILKLFPLLISILLVLLVLLIVKLKEKLINRIRTEYFSLKKNPFDYLFTKWLSLGSVKATLTLNLYICSILSGEYQIFNFLFILLSCTLYNFIVTELKLDKLFFWPFLSLHFVKYCSLLSYWLRHPWLSGVIKSANPSGVRVLASSALVPKFTSPWEIPDDREIIGYTPPSDKEKVVDWICDKTGWDMNKVFSKIDLSDQNIKSITYLVGLKPNIYEYGIRKSNSNFNFVEGPQLQHLLPYRPEQDGLHCFKLKGYVEYKDIHNFVKDEPGRFVYMYLRHKNALYEMTRKLVIEKPNPVLCVLNAGSFVEYDSKIWELGSQRFALKDKNGIYHDLNTRSLIPSGIQTSRLGRASQIIWIKKDFNGNIKVKSEKFAKELGKSILIGEKSTKN
jgi:hypothetical protein